jgi:hypothetical protein
VINPVADSPLLALQIALFETLSANLSVPVFDEPPETEPKPYVVIGECTELPDNHHGGYGSETTHTLHVWTESEGFSEALTIVKEITGVLNHQNQRLSVEGHHIVSIRLDMTRTLRDPNPRLRHVPVRYRINTEQEKEGA